MAKDSAKNANDFVKKEQSILRSMMGSRPSIKAEDSRFDARMMNDGEAAKAAARKLVKDIDKRAFPVNE